MRIALLEDQRVLRESLSDVLQRLGHAVTASCADPSELLNQLQRDGAEVVLVDLKLTPDPHDESGWQAIRQLRQLHPDTRVVVLSGTHDPGDVDRARRIGAHGFLSKDTVNTQEILDTLERVRQGDAVFPLLGPTQAPPTRDVAPSLVARFNLTHREYEVLRCLGEGMDNAKIGAQLEITERTVRAHVSSLYKKLNAENRTQLALMAHDLGVRRSEA